MKLFTFVATLGLTCAAQTSYAATPITDIKLAFDEQRPRQIKVEVKWQAQSSILHMADWGAEQFPDGWAHFVKDLIVTDTQNKALMVNFNGKDQWQTSATPGQQLTLRYTVDMSHDQHAWPHGLDEAAYVKDDAIFSTGQALFVVPKDAENFKVSFDLPKTWKSSTPWPKENHSYKVDSYDALVSNVMMVGRHHEMVFKEGDFAVTVAVGQARRASVPMIEKVMRPAIREYVRLFGGVPKNNYLVTLHEGLTDGGGFDSSYSLLASEDFHQGNIIEWGHLVTHETLHMWNGTGMHPDANLEWVKEGFSEYYTFLTLYKLGIIDDQLLSKKFENHSRRVFAHRDGTALIDTVKNKQKYWDFMYGGGAIMALVLDHEIRQATSGKKTLEKVMHRLFSQYNGKSFNLEQFIAVVNETAGKDLTPLFQRYVIGKEKPDMKAAFAQLGFELVPTTTREIYLIDQANGKSLRRKWVGLKN